MDLSIKKIVMVALISSLILPVALAETARVYPTEDSFVRSRFPGTNFGTGDWSENLRAGYNTNFGTDRSYLKFDVSQIPGTITSAIFSIDPVSPQESPSINLFFVPSNAWSENTITWNNKPSHTTSIDSVPIPSGERIELDVSPIASGVFSFALIEENEDEEVQFFSKDHDTGVEGDEFFHPYIEVTYGEGTCNTEADTNCNGCVNLMEMVNLMLNYKLGETNLELIEMVNLMRQYKGGEISC